MAHTLSFVTLRSVLVSTLSHLPDYRTGQHVVYGIADAPVAAFAVLFDQESSFLSHQRDMQLDTGRNNAVGLFGIDQVPSDPQIRNLLDGSQKIHCSQRSVREVNARTHCSHSLVAPLLVAPSESRGADPGNRVHSTSGRRGEAG